MASRSLREEAGGMSIRDGLLVLAGAAFMQALWRWSTGALSVAALNAAIGLVATVAVGVMDGMRDRRKAG